MQSKLHEFDVIVVEDEKLVREELINGLNESKDFNIVGEAASVAAAFEVINNMTSDVLFLDIKLPDGTAFNLLDRLKKAGVDIPPVVICTGYRDFEYAKKLFNNYGDHLIYLLNKPFWENWQKHQENILDALFIKAQAGKWKQKKEVPILSIKTDQENRFVRPEEIIMIRTADKGSGKTEFVLTDEAILSPISLSKANAKLPHYFVQVNRYMTVNLLQIQSVLKSDWSIRMKNGEVVSIGISYLESFKQIMEGL